MKHYFTLILCLVLSGLSAQTTWTRCIGDANCSGDIIPQAIIHNGPNRLAVAARFTGCASSPYIGTFACHYLDGNGQVLWKLVSYENLAQISTDIAFMADSNIAVEYMQGMGQLGISWAAFDTSGNYLFSRNLTGRNMVAKRLIVSGNDVFLTGYLWSDAGKATGVIAKYHADGTFVGVRCYEVPGSNVVFNGGFINGNFLYVYGSSCLSGFPGSYYGMIVKMDMSGNILEENYYQYFETFEYAELLPNKMIAVVLQSFEYTLTSQNFVYFIAQDMSPFSLFRFGYPDAGKNLTLSYHPSGHVYAGGYCHLPSGEEDSYIHCFSAGGSYLWTRSNRFEVESDLIRDLSSPDECHLWGAGWRANSLETVMKMDPLATAGNVDTTILPITVDSNYTMNHVVATNLQEVYYTLTDTIIPLILDTASIFGVLCTFDTCWVYSGCFTTGFIDYDSRVNTTIYPNPAQAGESVILFFIGPQKSYIIRTVDGRIVSAGTTDQEGRINTSGLPQGIYLISGTEGGKSARLVVF